MPAIQPTANSLQANALCEFAGTSSIARRSVTLSKNEEKVIRVQLLESSQNFRIVQLKQAGRGKCNRFPLLLDVLPDLFLVLS